MARGEGSDRIWHGWRLQLPKPLKPYLFGCGPHHALTCSPCTWGGFKMHTNCFKIACWGLVAMRIAVRGPKVAQQAAAGLPLEPLSNISRFSYPWSHFKQCSYTKSHFKQISYTKSHWSWYMAEWTRLFLLARQTISQACQKCFFQNHFPVYNFLYPIDILAKGWKATVFL